MSRRGLLKLHRADLGVGVSGQLKQFDPEQTPSNPESVIALALSGDTAMRKASVAFQKNFGKFWRDEPKSRSSRQSCGLKTFRIPRLCRIDVI